MDLAHHVKKHKIFQPPGMVMFECRKTIQIAIAAIKKILRGTLQQRQLVCFYFFKMDWGAERQVDF